MQKFWFMHGPHYKMALCCILVLWEVRYPHFTGPLPKIWPCVSSCSCKGIGKYCGQLYISIRTEMVKFCTNFRIQKGGKLLQLTHLTISPNTTCEHIPWFLLEIQTPKLIHFSGQKSYEYKYKTFWLSCSVIVSTGIFDSQHAELKNYDCENQLLTWSN